jgi:hypothetical protein
LSEVFVDSVNQFHGGMQWCLVDVTTDETGNRGMGGSDEKQSGLPSELEKRTHLGIYVASTRMYL